MARERNQIKWNENKLKRTLKPKLISSAEKSVPPECHVILVLFVYIFNSYKTSEMIGFICEIKTMELTMTKAWRQS